MESYASRTIDLKPLVLFPRDGYTMFTPRQSPRGLVLRSRGAYVYIYIHTYMCIYTSTRALYCIKRNAENALRSNPLARWSLLTPLLLASLVPSFSLLSLSLDDFDPLGYGQFFSRISSEVSKHGKARARWTRRAN